MLSLRAEHIADEPESQKWHSVVEADLGHRGGFHITGQCVRIDFFHGLAFLPTAEEAVPCTEQAFVDVTAVKFEAAGYGEQGGIGAETLRKTLNLAWKIPFSAPDIVMGDLISQDEISDL